MLKGFVIVTAVLIAFIISGGVTVFIYFISSNEISEKLYELYEIYIVSGFIITWLIILAVLRYTLSKRHCS